MTTFRERTEAFIGELYGVSRMPVPAGDDHIENALTALIFDISGFEALNNFGDKRKTLNNSDISGAKKNVPDIKTFGDGDAWQLICKASSESEGWMKSTKAMQVGEAGCLVQVTTQQRNPDGSYALAEAITFVPCVHVVNEYADIKRLPDDPSGISSFSENLNNERAEALATMVPGSLTVAGRRLRPNFKEI